MKRIQRGFTLIELIVVIVILGILAATALPKFIDLSSDARTAVMKGVEGAMRSANTMIYGKAAAAGQMGATGTITILGSTNVETVYGYAKDGTELAKALDITNDVGVDSNVFSHKSASNPAKCSVTYTSAVSDSVPPTYQVDTSKC